MNRLLVTSIITLILSSGVWAQKSVVKHPSRATQAATQNQVDDDDAMPVVEDVVVYLNYDKDETASVEIKTSSKSGKLTNGQLGSFLQTFSKLPPIKTSTHKIVQLKPTYVFKPDLSQTLGAILDTIKTVRNPTTNNITIDLNDGLVLYVRRKAKASRVIKPNPLFLLIDVDAENKITLNGEEEGNMSDLKTLKNHLSDIFRARSDNGVLRIGSNTIDTTVNLLVSNSIKFGQVQKLVLAVSSVGADRIFLAFDRQDIVRKELILNIEASPVIR